MLKKVEKNKKIINKKTLSVKTSFPNSKKIYINSKKFKNVNVPMREDFIKRQGNQKYNSLRHFWLLFRSKY